MLVTITYKGLKLHVFGTHKPTHYSSDPGLPDEGATFEITEIYLAEPDEASITPVTCVYESLDRISDIEETVLNQLG